MRNWNWKLIGIYALIGGAIYGFIYWIWWRNNGRKCSFTDATGVHAGHYEKGVCVKDAVG